MICLYLYPQAWPSLQRFVQRNGNDSKGWEGSNSQSQSFLEGNNYTWNFTKIFFLLFWPEGAFCGPSIPTSFATICPMWLLSHFSKVVLLSRRTRKKFARLKSLLDIHDLKRLYRRGDYDPLWKSQKLSRDVFGILILAYQLSIKFLWRSGWFMHKYSERLHRQVGWKFKLFKGII